MWLDKLFYVNLRLNVSSAKCFTKSYFPLLYSRKELDLRTLDWFNNCFWNSHACNKLKGNIIPRDAYHAAIVTWGGGRKLSYTEMLSHQWIKVSYCNIDVIVKKNRIERFIWVSQGYLCFLLWMMSNFWSEFWLMERNTLWRISSRVLKGGWRGREGGSGGAYFRHKILEAIYSPRKSSKLYSNSAKKTETHLSYSMLRNKNMKYLNWTNKNYPSKEFG